MDRREFLKTVCAAGGSAITLRQAIAAENGFKTEFKGVLVDTTRCIGCRSCEAACAETNALPVPDIFNESVFEKERKTSETQWTVVNKYNTEKGIVFAKKQCMHCSIPACASACLTKAMYKTVEGPVIWRGQKCMGCRFCMISCPFDMPKFEYNSPNPKILKCVMCWERLNKNERPACVEACPMNTLLFGNRRELIEEANSRIYSDPDKYIHHIYGEHEAAGTEWLYISPVPFEQLGFNIDIGTTAYPELSKGFLYGVPIVLLLWPAFLTGISYVTRREEINSKGGRK